MVREEIAFTAEEELARDEEEAVNMTAVAREEAKARTLTHLVALTTVDFPSVTSVAGFDVLRLLNTALPGNSGSQELRTAVARDAYAQAKLVEIDSFDLETALDYNPATDAGWP